MEVRVSNNLPSALKESTLNRDYSSVITKFNTLPLLSLNEDPNYSQRFCDLVLYAPTYSTLFLFVHCLVIKSASLISNINLAQNLLVLKYIHTCIFEQINRVIVPEASAGIPDLYYVIGDCKFKVFRD